MLQDFDRKFLVKCYELAREARSAPAKIPSPLEPTWSAVIGEGDALISSAVFRPGDAQDAVFPLVVPEPELSTLYLSIEPSSVYVRIAPTIESIRRLGVKRVVIGAEDPAPRHRGKGIQSLQKLGLEVLLANGEEARNCQLLYEDYAKISIKSLPVLRLLWELSPHQKKGSDYSLSLFKKNNPLMSDALLVSAEALSKQEKPLALEPWICVIDAGAVIDASYEWIAKNANSVLLFLPEGKSCNIPGVRSYSVLRQGAKGLDLAPALKVIRDLGLYSLLCKGDESLFQNAIAAGLVDSAVSFMENTIASQEILSRLSQAKIHFQKSPDELSLYSPRLLAKKEGDLWVESEISRSSKLN